MGKWRTAIARSIRWTIFSRYCCQRTMTNREAKRNVPHLLQAQHLSVCGQYRNHTSTISSTASSPSQLFAGGYAGVTCWRLTSGHLRIVSEGWAGSSENTMKLHSIDGLTQFGYATQRPIVLVGAVCDYLDSLFLLIPYLFFFFSPLLLLETVGKLQKHCLI